MGENHRNPDFSNLIYFSTHFRLRKNILHTHKITALNEWVLHFVNNSVLFSLSDICLEDNTELGAKTHTDKFEAFLNNSKSG